MKAKQLRTEESYVYELEFTEEERETILKFARERILDDEEALMQWVVRESLKFVVDLHNMDREETLKCKASQEVSPTLT